MYELFAESRIKNKTLEDISLDYERTEITTIFVHDKDEDSCINIFSVAEMCPHEQEKSSDIYDIKKDGEKVYLKKLNLSENKTVYMNRYFSNDPIDALNFYRGSGNKRILKMESKEISIGSACEKLIEEPLNEVPVIVPSSTQEKFSIREVLPKRKVSIRVCSLLDVEERSLNIFTEDDLTKIDGFIDEFLGISLLKYSEYFGAIILCFANPLLRYMKESISESKKQIILQLFERKNNTIIGGKVELSDERVSGRGFVVTQNIEKASFVVNIPCPPDKLRLRLFSCDGILIEDTSGYFIEEIRTNMGIIANKRKVKIENSEGENEEFEVDIVNYENNNYEERNTAQGAIIKNNKNRELDSLEEKREFIYFPGNSKESRKKAQMIVRELLGKAKERCVICDPYLSGSDVSQYALFVKHSNIQVKLLSSAKHLIGKVDNQLIRHGEYLKETIDNIISQDKTLDINCHVLLGRKKSPLHDRFIIIDDDAYLLGSSLNEFGSRATTLFKSPDPRPLIRQADIWFEDAKYSKHIDEWLKKSSNNSEVQEEC